MHSSKVIELAFVHAHALRQGREVWLGVGSNYEGGRCMHVRYTLAAVTCNLHNRAMLNMARSPRRRPRLCKPDRTCRAKSRAALSKNLSTAATSAGAQVHARARARTDAVVRHTPPHCPTATSRRHLGGCSRIVNSTKHLSVSAECAPTARARMHAQDKRHQLTSGTHRLSCSTRALLKLAVRLHPNSIQTENLLGRSGI